MVVEISVNEPCPDPDDRGDMDSHLEGLVENALQKISQIYFLVECLEDDDSPNRVDYNEEQYSVAQDQIQIVIEPQRDSLE